MEGVKVACGQITWGWGNAAPSQEQILSEIAQAGYEGAPAGRSGDRTAQQILDLYARYGLKPAPGYLGLEWWKPALRSEQLQQAARQAALARELGLSQIYVASNLTPERMALAGQITARTATPTEELKKLAGLLDEIGRTTLKEGVSICFHNHVGSPVETRDEIDRLFAQVDPNVVFMGPDTGHLAWAGDDVVQLVKDYAPIIMTMHVKDINPKVREEGVEKKWNYRQFAEHGIFAELGEGMVDFPAVFDILKQAGFKGWLVVETDVTQKATPLESATISRNYLKSIGI